MITSWKSKRNDLDRKARVFNWWQDHITRYQIRGARHAGRKVPEGYDLKPRGGIESNKLESSDDGSSSVLAPGKACQNLLEFWNFAVPINH